MTSFISPENGDRAKAISWFMHEGFGQGAAGNKAATYLLIASPTPGDSQARTPIGKGKAKAVDSRLGTGQPRSGKTISEPTAQQDATPETAPSSTALAEQTTPNHTKREIIPLNVNVQLHIGADASNEQIETIFSAMKRYLYSHEYNK